MHVSRHNMVFDINQPGRTQEKLLFNPLSRALDIVTPEVVKLLGILENQPSQDDAILERLPYLVDRGYCYRNAGEEAQRIDDEYRRAQDASASQPITFLISPTYACNLRCTYCFQQYMNVQYKPELMTEEMVNKALEFIVSQVTGSLALRMPMVYLFGGEPLLRAPKYREITELILGKCRAFGIPLGIVTNGVFLDEYITQLRDMKVFDIKITLNGSRRVHDKVRVSSSGRGTYDVIMRNLGLAIEAGLPITINGVGNAEMYESLPELVDDFDQRGWLDLSRDRFRFQAQHECSELFDDSPARIGQKKRVLSQYGIDAHATHRDQYQRTRIDTLRLFTTVGNTNAKTQKLLTPDCGGVLYILDNGQVPPANFFCPTRGVTWSLDVHGNLFVCVGGTGDQNAVVGKYYPSIEFDNDKLHRWTTQKNVFDLEKCIDCKVRFSCGSGCARLSVPADAGNPVCEPVQEVMQIGFDYYFPRIEQKWKRDGWRRLVS